MKYGGGERTTRSASFKPVLNPTDRAVRSPSNSMKNFLLLLTVLFFSGRAVAAAETLSAADSAKLDAAEAAMFASFGAGDAAAFGQLAGEDYLTINANGVMLGKTDALKLVPKFKGSTSTLSEQQRRVYGPTAVSTGRAQFKVKGVLVAEIYYTAIWVLRDGRWQFVNWQGTMTGLPSWYPVIVTIVLFLLLLAIAAWIRRRRRKKLAAA